MEETEIVKLFALVLAICVTYAFYIHLKRMEEWEEKCTKEEEEINKKLQSDESNDDFRF